MQGHLKIAKKHWPKCHVSEGADHMDVYDHESGELLVAARRDGHGRLMCAQGETKAKYPLGVLQTPDNLSENEAYKKEQAEKAAKAKHAAHVAAAASVGIESQAAAPASSS